MNRYDILLGKNPPIKNVSLKEIDLTSTSCNNTTTLTQEILEESLKKINQLGSLRSRYSTGTLSSHPMPIMMENTPKGQEKERVEFPMRTGIPLSFYLRDNI